MQRILSAIVILAFALCLSGCSIIGSNIGRKSDTRASRGLSRFDRVDDLSEGLPSHWSPHTVIRSKENWLD